MPPKQSSSSSTAAPQKPTKQELEAINNYIAQKPNFDKLIADAKAKPAKPASLPEQATEYDCKIKEAVKASLADRGNTTSKTSSIMPVLPQEEEAGTNLTDKIAKQSKDSGASDHPLHAGGEGKAKAEHHQANSGPVIAENLGQPTSKEENRKRAEELNK